MTLKIKILVLCIATFSLLIFDRLSLFAQSSKNVVVSFDYNKVSRSGSNQFAIWVAAKDGKFIKTLYVTKFTGFGGYNKRPDALPVWAKNHAKVGLDAVTMATPNTSRVVCEWHFTDASGKGLPKDDEYTIYVEATTYTKDNVLYTAIISPNSIELSAKYSNDEAKKSNMIENVEVRYK